MNLSEATLAVHLGLYAIEVGLNEPFFCWDCQQIRDNYDSVRIVSAG
jgi:hypothetical protein